MTMVSPYVLRETGGNLVRNIVMTVAAVVTMAVSLTALGGVLIMRQAVNKATVQWQGGVQVAIFMEPTASTQEIAAIRHELGGMVPDRGQELPLRRQVPGVHRVQGDVQRRAGPGQGHDRGRRCRPRSGWCRRRRRASSSWPAITTTSRASTTWATRGR